MSDRSPLECPYLSEDQRELSALDLKGRSEWMAEWLALADMAEKAPLLRKLLSARQVGTKREPKGDRCQTDLISAANSVRPPACRAKERFFQRVAKARRF